MFTSLLPAIVNASGVILDVPEKASTLPWQPFVFIPFGIVVLFGLIGAIIEADGEIFVGSFIIGICAALVGMLVWILFTPNDSYADEDYKKTAEILSKESGVKITATEVKNSKLFDVLAKGGVDKLEFFEDYNRDAKTGEWGTEIRSFLVDGKVVEVHRKFTPMDGEVLSKDK